MNNMIITIAAIRLFVLVGWFVYFLFEKNQRKLMAMLVLALIIPNVLAVLTGLVGL